MIKISTSIPYMILLMLYGGTHENRTRCLLIDNQTFKPLNFHPALIRVASLNQTLPIPAFKAGGTVRFYSVPLTPPGWLRFPATLMIGDPTRIRTSDLVGRNHLFLFR